MQYAVDFFLDVLKMIQRLGLMNDDGCKAMVEQMMQRFILALATDWASNKATGESKQQWWDDVKAYAGLVVDGLRYTRIMSTPEEQLVDVAEDIAIVVEASVLGDKLWGYAASLTMSSRMQDHLHTELQKLTYPLTAAKMEAVSASSYAELEKLKGEKALAGKRKITIPYRGVPAVVEMTGWGHEMMCRVALFLV